MFFALHFGYNELKNSYLLLFYLFFKRQEYKKALYKKKTSFLKL